MSTNFRSSDWSDPRYQQNKSQLDKAREATRKDYQNQKQASSKESQKRVLPSRFSKVSLESDWPYMVALIIALLKDVLDIFQFTVIPPIPELFAIVIGMMLLLGSVLGNGEFSSVKNKTTSAKKQFKIAMKKGARWAEKVLTWILGEAVELVPIIDLLPMETAIVVIVYFMTLSDRLPEKE